MNQKMVALLIAGACLTLTACGDDGVASQISHYDPAEVQMLRDQAKVAGIAADDKLILSTLRNRDDCRTIRKGLTSLAQGVAPAEVATSLRVLVSGNRSRGQADQADYYEQVIDELTLGDSSNLQEYLANNCADVK
ncbi:hypothetical protein [Cellulomonas sp. P24]|uniref:hypothetical protein n=1 Tax=Cellulomonas sp. P24 TaxID=2885206 RepID=UPI00216AEB03|nr:hypothetical protein [Cellulomonas sp. P24]MCR6492008.1 hypothetical protein [Cellulomonas sp. P24]